MQEKTQFTHADLKNSNFKKSACKKCIFMFADTENVNFDGAKMNHANFYGSNINQSQLDSMKSYDCATLPDGTVYDKNGEIRCDY